VIVSPEIVVSIPSPPVIFKVSDNKLIEADVEVSSTIVNVVATEAVPAAVKRPC